MVKVQNADKIAKADRCLTCNGRGVYLVKGCNEKCPWCRGTGIKQQSK